MLLGSGLRRALTEKVSDFFRGGLVSETGVMEGGLGEGELGLEGGGESTSSSGEELGDGFGEDASQLLPWL